MSDSFMIRRSSPDSEQYDTKVFKSLIDVIHLITEDTRYQQFVPVLDLYIQENFSATLAYNKLLLVNINCVYFVNVIVIHFYVLI